MNDHLTGVQAFGAGDGQRPIGLSPAKQALLELRLRKGAKASPRHTIPRRTSSGPVPLSFAQELLWLLDQLNPGLSVYNVPRAMRIRGELNRPALQKALDAIVARHEVLRTTVALLDGSPVQMIRDRASVELPVIDLAAWPEAEREREVLRLVEEETRRPFNLASDLLLRAALLRLGEREHVLLLATHHIASDGWSKGVMFRELGVLYDAFCAGRLSPLAELPIQYADFAVWQRQWLNGEILEKQLSYWKSRLAGAPALLQLPTDRPRPAIQTFQGKARVSVFPMSVLQGLKRLSQREETTLFMTLLAAFDVLLCRCTGQEDILVGTPIAGRNLPELDSLIGYFTNTLVLRTDLSGNPTFRELLRRVRMVALEAYDHQDLPFEKLVVDLRPDRNLSYTPLFQVLFSVGHTPLYVPELSGLTLSPIIVDRGIAKFDFGVGMTELPDGLGAGCEYSTDLFDAETITRMMGHFHTLLEGIVANPDQRISDLPVLSSAERRQLLVDWNDTRAEFPGDACIHQLIEDQVMRTPEATAVAFADCQLTYLELNERANQLAHYLRRRRIGPDVLVGICVERSLEMAIGLLGILKAGAAYVPLDPAYPAERLTFMLQDAQVPVLLTQQRLRPALPQLKAEVICLDSDWSSIARESTQNPNINTKSDNLAYCIYTSGSTGKPRGVLLTHRGMVNHNTAAAKEYDLGPADRILQFSSLSFDIAVEEIFPAWVTGAAVILRSEDMPLSGPSFLRWIEQRQITVLDLPTAYWHEWVHELSLQQNSLPEGLRLVIVGGEKALPKAFSTWLRAGGNQVRWLNTYGPTEASVVATVYEPKGPPENYDAPSELPIGRPLANTQVYILDGNLQLVPIGVPGELHIGGLGLARGYLNRPELTAERFVPNPFSENPGARLYRSGDLARYRRDGQIEFLGRMDHQVKVRGFRIELGEIEVVLSRHPAVREAVVMAIEDARGDKRLTAYVVPSQSPALPAASLRSYLKDELPEYMVPPTFVLLSGLPKTPNGKVDRRALPAPDCSSSDTKHAPTAPRNAVELQLTMLWEDVLCIKPIRVDENFFELGGHSLLAVRLFAQIEKTFGKSLPLAALFQAPTIEQQARILGQEDESHTWPTLIEIQPGGSRQPFFCVAAPYANALGYAFLARHIGNDQPIYGLQSHFRKNTDSPYTQAEYEALAVHYIAAMRNVQPQGPYLLGGMCEGAHIAFEMARQLNGQNQEVGLLAMFDAWPVENTKSYFFWAVDHYRNRLRSFLGLGFAEQYRMAYEKAKSALGSISRMVLRGFVRRKSAQPPDVWQAVLWPGPDFVPPTHPGRITLFRVRKQPYWRIRDPLMGWGDRATGGVEVHVIPGEHRTILREPHVQVLAKELRACIDQVGAANGRAHPCALSV